MKYTLYLVLLLAFSPSAEFTQAKESFDAGAITQWQDKWSLRPIEASITNISSTNVTITFNFRISTELPIGSVAEIHFPSQITTPSSPSIHQFVEIQKANSEISVQVTGVTLPDNS